MTSHQDGRWCSKGWGPGGKLNTAATKTEATKSDEFKNNTFFCNLFPPRFPKECKQLILLLVYCLATFLVCTRVIDYFQMKRRNKSPNQDVFPPGFRDFLPILHDCMIQLLAVIWLHYYLCLCPSPPLSLSHRHTHSQSLQRNWSLVTNMQHLIWMFFPGS